MFDYKYIHFNQFLDSMLVMNKVSHQALPILFPDQTVLIEIDQTKNFFDNYFI